jgi:hypothetical protein
MSRWFTLIALIELQQFVGGTAFDNVEPSGGAPFPGCR